MPHRERTQSNEPPAVDRATIDGGVELAYAHHGAGEPVVLVHGSLTDHRYWTRSRQLHLLGERYRAIAYSRRYNYPNRNAPTGDHSPMVEADDLAGLIDHLGTGPLHALRRVERSWRHDVGSGVAPLPR